MNTLPTAPALEFRPPTLADMAAMAQLLAEAFSQHGAPARAAGLKADAIVRMVQAMSADALRAGLCCVAHERASGQMLGAVLADDFANEADIDLAQLAPAFAPIGAMLGALDTPYRATHAVVPGQYLHLFMIGVAQHVCGRGIGQNMVAACIAHARARGYRVALAEATGAASQALLRKLGFGVLAEVDYQAFRFNGQAVFGGIRETSGAQLMELVW